MARRRRRALELTLAVVAERSLWGQSGGMPILPCILDHNSLVGAAELAWQPVLDDPLTALA